MKILVTGFEPFGGESRNPSLEAVMALPGEIMGAVIVKCAVPVTFAGAGCRVLEAIEREEPDAVLCVGQAGGRSALTPERVALNLDDASIPDNAGAQPVDLPIDPAGRSALFSTLPVKKMVAAIQAAGVPAQLSLSAGTFVCNHLLYTVLAYLEAHRPAVRAGFLHVPFLPEQAAAHPGAPSLPAEEILKGLIAALTALIP